MPTSLSVMLLTFFYYLALLHQASIFYGFVLAYSNANEDPYDIQVRMVWVLFKRDLHFF
ncbi:MAG: hypothetical protein HUU10_12180 [Bacteroidetes bacterium]|nr:hypothetical protein [Bacteroidota bacterium]